MKFFILHSGSAQATRRLCTASGCAGRLGTASGCAQPAQWLCILRKYYKCVSIAKIFTAAVHRQPSGCAQPATVPAQCTASPVAVHSQPVAVHSQPVAVHSQPSGCVYCENISLIYTALLCI